MLCNYVSPITKINFYRLRVYVSDAFFSGICLLL
jgi:hypothetical protein